MKVNTFYLHYFIKKSTISSIIQPSIMMNEDQEIPVAGPFNGKYTAILNLTTNDNDTGTDSNHSQISIYSDTEDSPIILHDEIRHQKENNKQSKRLNTFTSPIVKRPRLNLVDICKSESFIRPKFLSWLRSNQHLRTIKGGASKIFECLDKVRAENPALDKIFLAIAEHDEKVNPHFFDIAEIKLPGQSVIQPPHWNQRIDKGATYVWSFDIPTKNVKGYCEEIEKDISDHPDNNPDSNDYRTAIVAQFCNYLENELPLRKTAEVFLWLYVGQRIQSPPSKRWLCYYEKEKQRSVL
jgi:hypothetical protein